MPFIHQQSLLCTTIIYFLYDILKSDELFTRKLADFNADVLTSDYTENRNCDGKK